MLGKRKKAFLLRLLKSAKNPKERKRTVNRSSIKDLNFLRNICYSICQCKLPFKAHVKKRLAKHKSMIRALANKKKFRSEKALKRQLNQKGSGLFLTALVPAILNLLSSVGSSLISKRAKPE
jgi:hypothetical protein